MSKLTQRFVPLMVAAGMIVGIVVGVFFSSRTQSGSVSIINSSSNKVNDLLHLIDDYYVDTVDISQLTEKSLSHIVAELDPHSTYISAANAKNSMEDLQGSFSGIGVRFTILDDTVCVVRVLPNGPSEKAGLVAGDRIVAVDDKPYVGEGVTNDSTLLLLKGPAKTTVKLGLKRRGKKELVNVNVVRGDVPLYSVDARYMLEKQTGYLRLSNFSVSTYSEFIVAMAQLRSEGMEQLVLDLRGNPGGYMEPAVQIANEFLPEGRLIVYTEGRTMKRENSKTDGRGAFKDLPLVVLVDEFTASASEILAGALQDNDRAVVVGRRTFGKGLVQVPIEFSDGSILRLTKARYYTPSGRCLQKPYKPGDENEYDKELLLRELSGEYYSMDSIRLSGQIYHTVGGRSVYGGGGIVPDEFVPHDTTGNSPYLRTVLMNGLLAKFAFRYVDDRRPFFSRMKDEEELMHYVSAHPLLASFAAFAQREGVEPVQADLARSAGFIEERLRQYIISDLFDELALVRFNNKTDNSVIRALELIRAQKTFPEVGRKQAQAAPSHAVQRLFSRMMAFFIVPEWLQRVPSQQAVAGQGRKSSKEKA